MISYLFAKSLRLSLYTMLTAIFTMNFNVVHAQTWTQQSDGMYGGDVRAIAAKGNYIFAATYDAGIFRSGDKGASWTAVNNGITTKQFTSLAVKGDSIFAGCFFNNISLSVNNGDTWRQLSISGLGNQQITSLCLFNKKLFAGTVDGIYVTSNFSMWTPVNTGLPPGSSPYAYTWITTISSFGSTLIAGSLYQGAFLSKDDGATWTSVTGIPSGIGVSCFLQSNSLMYLGTNMGIYLSANNGDTWSPIGTGISGAINSIAKIGTTLIAATSFGLYRSTDNGSVWSFQSFGPSSTQDQSNTIFTNGSDIYVGQSANGVYHSLDGVSWELRSNGLTALKVTSFTAQKNYLFATTPRGVYKSLKNSGQWTYIGRFNGRVVAKGDSLLAFSYNGGYPVVFSTDYGVSWTMFSSLGLPYGYSQMLDVYKGNIFANTDNGLSMFSKKSNSWVTSIGTTPDYFSSMTSVGDTLFVGTWYGNFYVSTDNGVKWTNKNAGLPPGYGINSIATAGNHVLAATDQGVFTTIVNPISWSKANMNTMINFQYLFSGSGNVFAGDFVIGAYWSPDKGASWHSAASDYMSNVGFLSFASTDSLIFAGTTEGVWTASVSDFSPSISSFNPTSGVVGTNVTITGKNFSADRKSNSVLINGVPAEVTGAGFNTLIVSVPQGATTGLINITVNGKKVTSSKQFCVTASMPTVSLSTSSTNNPTLTSSSSTGNQWLLNGTPISGATGQTYNPTVSGNYSVLVSSGDCQFQSSDYNYVVTGLEPTNAVSLQAYPIPFHDELYVSLGNFKQGSLVQIRLIDMLGAEVGRWVDSGGSVLTIPTRHLGSGLYILTTTQESRNYSLRVVKY